MALTKIKADGLTADLIDETKLADNSIDSEHYNDGSIDNAHLADDAVGVAELSATGTASSSTFLRGDNSWAAVTSTTINNNADNRVITGSGTANTLEGEANLTFDGTSLLTVHVPSATGEPALNFTNSDTGTGTGNGFGLGINGSESPYIWNRENTDLRIATNNTERLRINSAGTVIMGATSYGGGGDVPALYVSSTSGRQVKIHNTNANTTSLQLSNASTGEGDDAGMMFAALGNSGDGWINNAENAAIRFGTNGTERMRILAGGGLTFNGDTAAANALDDYEEGTFTPNFDAAGGVTFSYSHQYGYYTKVGNLVNFQLYIQGYASTITSGNHNNAVAIQGLPFTIANITRYYPAFTIGRTYKWDVNSDQRVYAYGELNTSIARIIVEEDDQTGGLLVANQLDNNTCLIHLAGAYRV